MQTNIEIDDDSLAEAMQATGPTTKNATVEAGLAELIRRPPSQPAVGAWFDVGRCRFGPSTYIH
jgi:hypothetical protein